MLDSIIVYVIWHKERASTRRGGAGAASLIRFNVTRMTECRAAGIIVYNYIICLLSVRGSWERGPTERLNAPRRAGWISVRVKRIHHAFPPVYIYIYILACRRLINWRGLQSDNRPCEIVAHEFHVLLTARARHRIIHEIFPASAWVYILCILCCKRGIIAVTSISISSRVRIGAAYTRWFMLEEVYLYVPRKIDV